MALANVPPGEQRCRFLAVGLADNTVRIISLDPAVSICTRVRMAFCECTVTRLASGCVFEQQTVFMLFVITFCLYRK
jgi:hypothetical protein